jgi:hypothetical protein
VVVVVEVVAVELAVVGGGDGVVELVVVGGGVVALVVVG